jgi:hypothetical protein
MPTIKCGSIEKPVNTFICNVLRGESSMRYQDTDGKLKPVQPERWEQWNVLAETEAGAKKIAEYHFYQSDKNNIQIVPNNL